ncbi:MAG: hypothetical protein NC313_10155 [Butyrivibrio sp.]|nr:hypothetical protein [Butyrivibrio sp.]
MIKVFVLMGVFIIIVYVYSFIKIKKNKDKTKNIDSIRDFHDSYGKLINTQPKIEKIDGYNRYVTKYNSSEDYREKS